MMNTAAFGSSCGLLAEKIIRQIKSGHADDGQNLTKI
jgi:hypothetical protein